MVVVCLRGELRIRAAVRADSEYHIFLFSIAL